MENTEQTTVTASRSSLLEALLTFSTAGIYLAVWFVVTAKNLRRITGQSLKPALWFFVPLFAPLQPFALPVFFKRLRRAEHEAGIKNQFHVIDYGWMTGMFALSLYFLLADFIDTTLKADLWVFFCYVLWQLPLLHRVNRLKRRFSQYTLMPRHYGFNIIEWFAVLLVLPLLVCLYGWSIYLLAVK